MDPCRTCREVDIVRTGQKDWGWVAHGIHTEYRIPEPRSAPATVAPPGRDCLCRMLGTHTIGWPSVQVGTVAKLRATVEWRS